MLYNKKGVKKRDDEENDEKRMKIMKKNRPDDVSLRASSPFGGYHEKYTCERHARGDAPRGFAACSHVLTRLTSLAQIGELARRLR